MNRSLHGLAVIAILAGAWLSGCASGPRAEKRAGRPGDSGGGRSVKVYRSLAEVPPDFGPSALTIGNFDGVHYGHRQILRRVKAIAHFAAGISAELNDDDPVALEHYLKSAAADPGHEALVLELARRFLQNKQVDQAIDLLAKATGSPSASGKLLAWLGLAYAEAGKTDLAIQADQAAIKQSPDLLMGYRNLSAIYQQSRQPGEALKVLDDASGQSSGDPQFWIELGELYANYNQLHPEESQSLKPKVVATLDRAAALKPENLLVIQRLADGYKSAGEFARAEEYYLELLDRFPALPGTREKLADIYLRTGKKDKAAEQLAAISRDNPRNEQAYYYLGNIAYQEKRFSDAANYFEQALTLKPEFEPVY